MTSDLLQINGNEPPARPLIGINMGIPDAEATGSTPLQVQSTFIDSVVKAGGMPVIIPPVLSEELMARYLDLVAGFVFTGGPDLDPVRYGQERHEKMLPVNPRREEFDIAFMARALRTGKPVVAICLGMQELCVLCGGTLVQDLPSLRPGPIDHKPDMPSSHLTHPVEIEPGTLLASLTGGGSFPANSIHHQSVDSPGGGAIVSARAPDGVVEAIELPGHPFALGIQWHPEALFHEPTHLAIFEGLVRAAMAGVPQPVAGPA